MSSIINHTISNVINNRIMTEFLFLLLFSISFNHHSIQVSAQKGTATLTENDEVFNRISSRQPSLPPLNSQSDDFTPTVSATCRAGIMTIKVETPINFIGVVHARDYREPQCSGYGENSRITLLRLNLLAREEDRDYCGVFYSQPNSDERSVAVALRTHKTLELVDDKFYMITCGKAGFQNSRNETSLVNLQLLRNEQKVEQVVYGREYTLRADIGDDHDGQFGMKVKRCFSFSDTNNTVQLVDERGCPEKNIMSAFKYDVATGKAEAKLYSMFKFPESNRVHFQCDILVCNARSDDCETPICDYNKKSGRSLDDQNPEALLQQPAEEGALMASYSVFVLEPGEQVDVESVCTDCSSSPDWVWPLCITFGILFLVMLIINVFLCSAMTCSCARSTIEMEKEPSIIEEFDPYTRSWHGSQYGSRYSLNDKIKPIPPPLISVDTSHSISSASENGLPAVYGVPVHSRPSSRYSNRSHRTKRDHRAHQPPPQASLHAYQSHSSSSGGSSAQYSKYSNGRMIIK